MADENTPQVVEPQVNPVEAKAMEQGWVPQDQWQGDPDQWRPAKEFLDRGELFKKIDEQNRTLKEFRKTIDDLKSHNSKIAEIEYKRALDSLRKQKRDALAEGDADAVVEIEDRIDAVKEAQREVAAAPRQDVAAEVHPVFQAWVEKNPWFNNNRAMRSFANDVGREAAASGKTPSEVLEIVEKEVKKEFADKFKNPRREAPSSVEGSTNRGTSKADDYQLTDMERQVMNRFVRQGVMTKEEYIKQLKGKK